jgi:isoquinoline 1-oxidoreductase beta subunit
MLEHLTGGSAENSIGSMQAALSRRTFLKVSSAATGGLLMSIKLPAQMREAEAADAERFAPNAFIRIDRQGAVTLVMPMVEMGQGTYTSLAMLLAEELEVGLDQVKLEHARPTMRSTPIRSSTSS